MDLIKIYEELKASGYVIDQYTFDREWLGRQPGYTAYIRSTSAEPSIETLFKLHLRLLQAENRYSIYGINTGQLANLAEHVFFEMKKRAMCAIPIVPSTRRIQAIAI